MPFEITNSLRGQSVIRAVDAGTYTITLNDLRANATIETVTAADIKRVMWSTNGSITITRNGIPQLALHTGGVMDFADFAHSGQVCIVRQMHAFSEKVCTKSAQSVQSMHVFCTKSADQPRIFLGKTPG